MMVLLQSVKMQVSVHEAGLLGSLTPAVVYSSLLGICVSTMAHGICFSAQAPLSWQGMVHDCETYKVCLARALSRPVKLTECMQRGTLNVMQRGVFQREHDRIVYGDYNTSRFGVHQDESCKVRRWAWCPHSSCDLHCCS